MIIFHVMSVFADPELFFLPRATLAIATSRLLRVSPFPLQCFPPLICRWVRDPNSTTRSRNHIPKSKTEMTMPSLIKKTKTPASTTRTMKTRWATATMATTGQRVRYGRGDEESKPSRELAGQRGGEKSRSTRMSRAIRTTRTTTTMKAKVRARPRGR